MIGAINTALSVAVILAWLFAGLYVTRSQWRATPQGRSLLYVDVAFAVLGTYIVIVEVTNATFLNPVLLAMSLVLAGTMGHRVGVLWATQRQERRRGGDGG